MLYYCASDDKCNCALIFVLQKYGHKVSRMSSLEETRLAGRECSESGVTIWPLCPLGRNMTPGSPGAAGSSGTPRAWCAGALGAPDSRYIIGLDPLWIGVCSPSLSIAVIRSHNCNYHYRCSVLVCLITLLLPRESTCSSRTHLTPRVIDLRRV